MSFISLYFLALFSITLLARFTFGRKSNKKSFLIFLLAASLIFYGSYDPLYLLLLFGITGIDYFAGNKIREASDRLVKKRYLLLSLLTNLGLLMFFKYSNFLLDNLGALLGLFGLMSWQPAPLVMALPLGISFFTFQSMSYTLDIYRGTLQPERRYWRFLLFVSFFTHLISGPIVRARELIYQFDRVRQPRLRVFKAGAQWMIRGFFLKMVVADNLSYYVNRYWARDAFHGGSAPFSLGLAALFSCQIFADFEGYSSIARGAAYLLGFRLPLNFNNPYIACSFREFWSRWHITLSHWMRDYLYIPLGGNKVTPKRLYFNLFLVMVIAGLWHGAAYTFMVWGAIHGIALMIERVLGFQDSTKRPAVLKIFWFLVVQTVVLVAWIFFRAKSVEEAFDITGNLLSDRWSFESAIPILQGLVFAVPIVLIHVRGFFVERRWLPVSKPLEQALLCAVMLYCVLTLSGSNSDFIYFKF